MCGIYAVLQYDGNPTDYRVKFMKGSGRGPENHNFVEHVDIQTLLGFHRLAINGLDEGSNQPLVLHNDKTNSEIELICNGEIYNYKELHKLCRTNPMTHSDCEIILHLYNKYGIEQTLTMLDGVFAFILLDRHNKCIYVARDPLGVRPLYMQTPSETNKSVAFASVLKCLQTEDPTVNIAHFKPSTYSKFEYIGDGPNAHWTMVAQDVSYHQFNHPTMNYSFDKILNNEVDMNILANIRKLFLTAIEKRCVCTERKVACLLSGGLDSSLVAALVADHFYKKDGTRIETYSIGLEGSEDLKYARHVAHHINSIHTEVIVTEDEMFNAIPEVIYEIESFDTTTVRASIGNYLIGKYISQNSRAKVIFNGDGSDELFGGYLYMNKCPDDIEFDKETRRLLKEIHAFDVLRSDKCISSHGLEPRTPFLDKTFVNYILSIPANNRNHNNLDNCIEKFLLRRSFEYYTNSLGLSILPKEIMYRKKEAFSDGVSSKGRSLYVILQEKICACLNGENNAGAYYMPTIDTEKLYYKTIFTNSLNIKNASTVDTFSKYWMPKYIDAKDPSARTLEIYNNLQVS
jgi:asparagine synthase (glutamine-hydrolysing)